MKLNVDLSRLEVARESIGASKASINQVTARRSLGQSPVEIELIEQGSIILSGEQLNKSLHFPGGLAAIGNVQITLHIYQPFVSFDDLTQLPATNPKFHVADCRTLEQMREKGRFNRYVSTAETEGYFRVEPWDHITKTRKNEIDANLAPCQNCLSFLNYDGFDNKLRAEKTELVNNFDITKFLKNYEPIFRCLPLYNADNFPEGNYTQDWARISEEHRERGNWTCISCNVDLSKHRQLLHVHHSDGNRGNNRPSNLKVLCCGCHKDEPFHQGMYISHSDQELLKALRKKTN